MKYQWPVDVKLGAYIIQYFGQHNRDYSPLLGHPGIDFYAPKGTPVYASHDGWMYQSVATDKAGFGIHFYEWYEENGFQYVTVYGHFLKSMFPDMFPGFQKNVPIKRGQLIGFCDSTGFSNIDHVHLGRFQYKNGVLLNKDNGYGGGLDFTSDLLSESDFTGMMSNAIFVHKAGTGEYGWYVPDISVDGLKSTALHYGAQIVKPDGSVDFSQAKEMTLI